MKKGIIGKILKKIEQQFLAGLLVIIPLALSLVIIYVLFTQFDSILGQIIRKYLGTHYIQGIGFVLLIVIIWLAGFVATNYFGKQIIRIYESIISKIPIFNSIFGGLKQISDTLLSGKKTSFQQVVLLKYPLNTGYFIGFLTSAEVVKLRKKAASEQLLHVFIPTAPTPTQGFVLLVPAKNVVPVDMTIEEGIKAVISMGVIHPKGYKSAALFGSRQIKAAARKAGKKR